LVNFTAHVPILRTLVWQMMNLGSENDILIFEHNKMNASAAHGLSPDVYGFISDRYGISLSTIDEIENEIVGIWSFPHVWKHPSIAHMISVDN